MMKVIVVVLQTLYCLIFLLYFIPFPIYLQRSIWKSFLEYLFDYNKLMRNILNVPNGVLLREILQRSHATYLHRCQQSTNVTSITQYRCPIKLSNKLKNAHSQRMHIVQTPIGQEHYTISEAKCLNRNSVEMTAMFFSLFVVAFVGHFVIGWQILH